MKRICAAFISIFLIMALLPTPSHAASSSVPEPVLRSAESVVRILAEYSDGYATGSGFVIKCDGEETLIATNYHVVEGNPYSISIWISESETISATILAYTEQKDMCVLNLSYPVALKPLTLASNGAKQGDAVYAVGFPAAADYLSDKEAHTSEAATITDGIVSAIRETTVSQHGTPTKVLQINAAINSGNSGGPLFNSSGEVIGINTYGINDSQGIFGAIDVSELRTFLADHSISLPSGTRTVSWAIFALGGFVLIAIIAVVVIVVMRKKNKVPGSQRKEMFTPLRDYMATHPDGLGVNTAVSLLLPVALQLRDLHNSGNAHLQVSPSSVYVGTNGAKLMDATVSEADRYSSGYAAPEIYRGKSAGNVSDIYSFCAVLWYVVSGLHPENSLARGDDAFLDAANCSSFGPDDTAFAEVLTTGMALNAGDRFDSMQEVIMKLSPYNTRSFTESVDTVPAPAVAPKKKAKVSKGAAVIILAGVLALLCLGSYIGCYLGARTYAQKGEFATANKLLFIPQLTRVHDSKLTTYTGAGLLMEERKYAEAKAIFGELSGYLNADQLSQESDYRYAVQCADANDFASAVSIMTELSEAEYKDSAAKLLEITYRNGVYLLFEKADYSNASKIFSQLSQKGYVGAEDMYKEAQYLWAIALVEEGDYILAYTKLEGIQGYSDVDDALSLVAALIYQEGQALYHKGEYYSAKRYFSNISNYEDSKQYITLIDVHNGVAGSLRTTVRKLTNMFYFEDTAELLLSRHSIAKEFLLGTWEGSDYYFTMETNGDISYNLPWFDYGDYYVIKNGELLLYPEYAENNTKALFSIEALSPDCISVFCYKNNHSYTLYRQ